MGEKKRLRTLIWKNQQLNNTIDEHIKELREKKNSNVPPKEKEKK